MVETVHMPWMPAFAGMTTRRSHHPVPPRGARATCFCRGFTGGQTPARGRPLNPLGCFCSGFTASLGATLGRAPSCGDGSGALLLQQICRDFISFPGSCRRAYGKTRHGSGPAAGSVAHKTTSKASLEFQDTRKGAYPSTNNRNIFLSNPDRGCRRTSGGYRWSRARQGRSSR